MPIISKTLVAKVSHVLQSPAPVMFAIKLPKDAVILDFVPIYCPGGPGIEAVHQSTQEDAEERESIFCIVDDSMVDNNIKLPTNIKYHSSVSVVNKVADVIVYDNFFIFETWGKKK
jgi:hypothetical protein